VTVSQCDQVKEHLLKETFDALIMSGRCASWNAPDIYRWLSEKCPGLEKRVLFTLATPNDTEVRDFLQANNVPFLVKPFELADLISAAGRLVQKTETAAVGK
jgi:fructose-1-phosphate kinase PfkB-like protein